MRLFLVLKGKCKEYGIGFVLVIPQNKLNILSTTMPLKNPAFIKGFYIKNQSEITVNTQ